MATGTELLKRITDEPSSLGPLLAPLGSVLTPLARSFWVSSAAIEPLPTSPDSCLVVGSDQVAHYHLTGSQGWTSYHTIAEAFAERRRRGESSRGAKTSILPEELVDTPVKLLIKDSDNPVQCTVVWERVYPKRAWVGALHSTQCLEMAFVIAAIINSALGQVLYHRIVRAKRDKAYRSHDIRKAVLSELRIPVLGYDVETFNRAALLSFRLHCLYQANRECALPFEVANVIRNHWLRLLSELIRLYHYSEADARELFNQVLPAGFKDDVLGIQMDLYYVPQEPLQQVALLSSDQLHSYEDLKEKARGGLLSPSEAANLDHLRRLIEWEDRINGPFPRELRPTPWPGIADEKAALKAAYRHLAYKHGQSFRAEDPRKLDGRIWEVNVYYSPPKALKAADAAALPAAWRKPGKHVVGTLRIDSITGNVTDRLHEATGAGASSPR